jgi:hypothetical protein
MGALSNSAPLRSASALSASYVVDPQTVFASPAPKEAIAQRAIGAPAPNEPIWSGSSLNPCRYNQADPAKSAI